MDHADIHRASIPRPVRYVLAGVKNRVFLGANAAAMRSRIGYGHRQNRRMAVDTAPSAARPQSD